jgi:hypothetical protein
MLEEQIEEHFKIPISLVNNNKTPDNLIKDLELYSSGESIYKLLFNSSTIFGKSGISQWINTYTTDIHFLKDNQHLIENFSNQQDIEDDKSTIDAWESYKNIKGDGNFHNKFQYINWSKLNFLNKSTTFLSALSMYNIISPVLNLTAPLVLLLVPFILLRYKKIPITISSYVKLLLVSLKNHSFGKLITQWSSLPWGQRIYLFVMAGFYVYNIYQNGASCYKFYQNSYTINKDIINLRIHLGRIKVKLETFMYKINKYESFEPYFNYLQDKLGKINELYDNLNEVPQHTFNPKKISKQGYTMKQYYCLYDSEEVKDILLFSFGFHGYIEKLSSISTLFKNKVIGKAKLINSKKPKIKFKKGYYPTVITDNIVKNDIFINRNKLITGPNASGKTTVLKTTVVNILLSQQIGFGFYKKATITPFDYLHCYINIPDTSSRDSLFQAEARRCLEILTSIKQNTDKKHFCIFDELFSGTNPYEAISSAQAYLQYISTIKNVRFLLTTHFIKLCEKLDSNKNIDNINMRTTILKDIPKYEYTISKGVSKIKGGILVLKELGYPDDIIDSTKKLINDL